MTTQAVETLGIEQRLSALEARITALEAVMTLFIEEQREYRREVNARFDRIEEEQREHRREVNARFDKIEEEQREHRREVNARFDKIEEEQREHRREVNARFDRLETRIDQVGSSIPKMLYTVIGIMSAVAVGLIVSNVVG